MISVECCCWPVGCVHVGIGGMFITGLKNFASTSGIVAVLAVRIVVGVAGIKGTWHLRIVVKRGQTRLIIVKN